MTGAMAKMQDEQKKPNQRLGSQNMQSAGRPSSRTLTRMPLFRRLMDGGQNVLALPPKVKEPMMKAEVLPELDAAIVIVVRPIIID